jgi:hypothetical protein
MAVMDTTFAQQKADFGRHLPPRADARDNTTTEGFLVSKAPSEFALAMLPATVADSSRHHEIRNSSPQLDPYISLAHDEIETRKMIQNISSLHPASPAIPAQIVRSSVSSDLAMPSNVGTAARIQNLRSANLGAFVLQANGESR